MNKDKTTRQKDRMPIKYRQHVSKQGIQNLSYIISGIFLMKLTSQSIREHGFLMRLPLEQLSLSEFLYFVLTIVLNISKCMFSFAFVAKSRVIVGIQLLVVEICIAYINLFHINHMYTSVFSLSAGIWFLAKMTSFCLFVAGNEKSVCTLSHFVYFLLVPTLFYKPQYARKTRINTRRLLHLGTRLVVSTLVWIFVIDQLAVPAIDKIQSSGSMHEFLENFLMLSVCTMLMFLLFFYVFFSCVLNITADLTMFGNAEFYGYWWNAHTVREFWSSWNRLAHVWFQTYIFVPLIERGYSKGMASLVCFLLSGVVHEYVISCATKVLRGWTFLGFFMQAVLMATTDKITLYFPQCGNFIFWSLFCVVGQPACIWLICRSSYLEKQRPRINKLPCGHAK